MKQTGLTQYDWVCFDERKFQVREITGEINNFVKDEKGMYWRSEDCKPIALTKEMLELNGIKYQYAKKGMPYYQYCDDGRIQFNYLDDDEGIEVYLRLPVKYVHELQRMLRVIGLYELADNFKIIKENDNNL